MVDFYVDKDGNAPVEEFISSLPEERQGCILQYLEMLREKGPTLPFPYSSQVEGKLRELRPHYGNELYRVLYYGDPLRQFILLHALCKKSDKLPDQDKQIALARMEEDSTRKAAKKRGQK